MTRSADDADVRRFIEAIAPGAADLYLAAFSEKQALNDAADLIDRLKAAIEEKDRALDRLEFSEGVPMGLCPGCGIEAGDYEHKPYCWHQKARKAGDE